MPPRGYKQSDSARAKISAARSIPQVECSCEWCGKSVLRGRSELRRRMLVFCNKDCEMAYRKGKPRSQEVKDRIGKSHKGLKKSQIHKDRLSAGAKRRFEDPAERKRVSDNAIGRIIADDTKKKMSDAHKVVAQDPEWKLKQVEGMIGGFWYGNVRYWYVDAPQYCEKFNKEFKERVRAFWDYKCFECGTPQNGKKLGIHHIHYDKKMCCNGSPRDVVPLCGVCHPKTNFNREWWEQYFTELLYAWSPEGKCFFTKEEMKEFLGG
jgi:hypothetical protein